MQKDYVKKAEVFLKENGGDYFVIGHINVMPNLKVPESPIFLQNKQISTKVKRLAGFGEEDARRILYHAESPEQAEAILKLFLQGKGYSVNKVPVIFDRIPNPLPED